MLLVTLLCLTCSAWLAQAGPCQIPQACFGAGGHPTHIRELSLPMTNERTTRPHEQQNRELKGNILVNTAMANSTHRSILPFNGRQSG